MPIVRRTPAAEQDLAQIVVYTANDNLSAAITWLEELSALFQLLSTHPKWASGRGDSRKPGVTRMAITPFITGHLQMA